VDDVADDNVEHGLLSLTTEIVASFVGNNPVAIGDLPAAIASVFKTLRALAQDKAEIPAAAPVPAVSIKKSVGTDFLICLEDGQKVKTLKRHLASHHQLTPDQYRQRWGLPKTYPMVSPAYAAQRSELARQIGLGRKSAAAAPSPAPATTSAAPEPPRRAAGRRKKTT
jgi:predicted transcriptional regulator